MLLDPAALSDFLNKLRVQYGYDFTNYAEASVIRRIVKFMKSRQVNDLGKLGSLLIADEILFEQFIQEISVTVTEMFRDPLFYKSLREKVIPRLATYPFIKIWIAGCATGEEVYSVAILLKEEGLIDRSLIYATDINQQSLQIARNGVYPVDRMKDYTWNYQEAGGKEAFSEYYKAKFDSVMFSPELITKVVFSAHNLAVDKSFNEFQLIICRNVLIYFNQKLQNDVIGLFYESLCQFGFLGLGNKESLLFSDRRKEFVDIDKKQKIFMKNGII